MKQFIGIIVDITYDMCVLYLMKLAQYTGLTYREVNFVVFMVVLPTILVSLGLIILVQYLHIKSIKKLIS